MTQILDVFVPGRPRTKGSLLAERTSTGRIRQADTVLSKEWRTLISNAVVPLIADLENGPTREVWRLREGWPISEPVKVSVIFQFAKPKSNTDVWPTARTFGDVDKLLRNVLDALKDAGLYKDDSLVQCVEGIKAFHGREGAWITAWTI